MSTQDLMRAFVLTSVTVLAGQAVAQESTGELKSVLVGEDLRPLIDLDAPSPSPVVTKSTATKPKVIAAPTKKSVLKSVVKSSTPSNGDKTNTKSELVDTPPPIIPGFAAPSVTTPTEAKPAPPAPVAKSVLKTPVTNVASNHADKAFEFGVATVESAGGVKVRGVFVDSPAQKLGVKPGDIIVAVNGSLLKTESQLTNLITAQDSLTKPFPVTVLRAGQQRVLSPRTTVSSVDKATASNTTGADVVPPPVEIVDSPAGPGRPGRQTYSQQSVLRRRVPARRTSASPSQVPQQITPTQPQVSSTGAPANPVSAATTPMPSSAASPTQPRPYPVTGLNPTASRPVPSGTPRVVPQTQQRVVRYPQQPQGRYAARPTQPQYRTAPNRPVIGDGGRLIGNGRLINSALRVIGL